MVGGSATRVAAGELLSPGIQRPPYAEPPRLAEQEGAFQVALRRECRDAPGGCCRSQTSRRTDRLPERSAYLGPDPAVAPPHSLRRAWWRIVAGSPTLDSGAQSFLSSR